MDFGTIGNDGANEPGDEHLRKHPPIHPKCAVEYFTQDMWRFKNGFHFALYIHDSNKYERKIISDLNRCAWLDEAQRLPLERSIDSAKSKALKNAESWRLWGLQK